MANPFAIAARRATQKPQARSFAAAEFSRLTADWINAHTRSADGDLQYQLRTLRNRARELDRNSPFGVKYSQLLAENVVGPAGFTLEPQNGEYDENGVIVLNARANRGIQDAFTEWSRPECCDVEGRLSLSELLSLGVSQWGPDGEILIRFYRGPQFGPCGFAIQVLDPDLLDETYNQDRIGTAVPLIRQGVEMDQFGRRVAFHLWTRHPQEAGFDRKRIPVPASDIIHAFIPRRAGQTRGIPHGAAIMTTLKMLEGYIEAELVAARTASAKMGAIEDADPTQPMTRDPNAGAQTVAVPEEASPGSLFDLRGSGGKLALWDPQHPTSGFSEFTRRLTHFIAMGLGISYYSLSGDLTGANYSSMRVGMLAERDHWERLQQFVVVHVLDRIYREWLKMALLNQQIAGITDYDVARWTRVHWQARGFPWIDPEADISAAQREVAMSVNSLTRVAARRGLNFEKILQERKRENDLAEQYGVVIGQDMYVETFGAAPLPGATDSSGGGDGTTDSTTDGADGTDDSTTKKQQAPKRDGRNVRSARIPSASSSVRVA